MFFKKSSENDRKNVDDVILLFTDGKPNAKDISQEIADADYYSKILKNENIKIIVVAAGDASSYRSNIQGWASSPSLVFETGLAKLGIEENVNRLVEKLKDPLCECEPKPEPGFCLCKGSGLQGFKVYAKPDEISTTVSWPENELLKCNTKVLPKPVLISPAGSKSGGQFEVRSKPHKITYSYRYKNYDGEYVDFNCSVKFTVKACGCPSTKTVQGQKLPGDNKKSFVTWIKPEPNCPYKPNSNNPQSTSGQFPVGKSTVTYKYTIGHGLNKFDIECHMNIHVSGEFCGSTAYDPATHVCCFDEVHKKTANHKCCGTKYYNASRKMCCQGENVVNLDGRCP